METLNEEPVEEPITASADVSGTRNNSSVIEEIKTVASPSEQRISFKEKEVVPSIKDTFLRKESIKQFNASQLYERRRTIQLLCDEIKPRIEQQDEVDALNSEINIILKMAENIKDSAIHAELRANLMLFKIAILNHNGEMSLIEIVSMQFIDPYNRCGMICNLPKKASLNPLSMFLVELHIDSFFRRRCCERKNATASFVLMP